MSGGHLLAVLSWAALLVCAGCDGTSGTTPATSPVANEGVELTGLTWVLAWDTNGVVLHDNGWSTTNSDGTTFTVDSGGLASYSAELVPCAPSVDDEQVGFETSPVWARRNLLERALGISLARADHGVDPDPSALREPIF